MRINRQVEVLTLAGDIALYQGKPAVHTHLVVGLNDASAKGGHLIEAHVFPTLDIRDSRDRRTSLFVMIGSDRKLLTRRAASSWFQAKLSHGGGQHHLCPPRENQMDADE